MIRHRQSTVYRNVISLCFLCLLSVTQANAQISSQFGKNKVHYQDFEWATLTTPHFTLYFYRGEERLSRNASRMAERAYLYLAETFQHQFAERIPLIIYGSSDDFQQTEVIDGLLGEGLGGVTESLRGRIVLPFLGSYREFNHVLLHELVHAFQFDILGESGVSMTFFSHVDLPLWFVEGMAEYLTEYQNPLTEMWLYDAVAHDALPKAGKMDALGDIRVYRLGESLNRFLAETYGDHVLGDLLREVGNTDRWDHAVTTVTETDWDDVYAAWIAEVETRYAVDTQHRLPPDRQADVLITHQPEKFALNILPAISPDGQYVAFMSDREWYRTIYLASAETGDILAPLVEGERRGTYETLRFLNTSIAWSPDSRQIAFNARAGGQNAIYVLDIETREIVQTLMPDVTSLSFLAWSPDGMQIAFTGTRNGQEDLFLIVLATGETTQLTDDVYSNRHPAWSPDGSSIAFTTDAGDWTDSALLQFGPSNLAVYNIDTQHIQLLTNTEYDDLNPVWSPDGEWLAYISARTGLYNLYLLPVSETAKSRFSGISAIQVTNVTTGIVGLTPDNPAVSWAQKTGTLVFSGFSDKGWDIFRLHNPIQTYAAYRAEAGDEAELRLNEASPSASAQPEKKDWHTPLPHDPPAEPQDYTARLRPDYIIGGGGGNDKSFILLARIGFSDMLANHQLNIGGNFTHIFNKSDFLIEYSNRANRLSYYLSLFQLNNYLGAYRMNGRELELELERGIGLTLLWPFDKFRRVEFGLEGRLANGTLTPPDAEDTYTMTDQFTVSPSMAYVHDTALYTAIGPLDGRRLRLAAYPAFGNLTYATIVADQRWYWHTTTRSTLAFRTTGYESLGENARIFEIGGSNTFRGRQAGDDDVLRGTRVFLGAAEYRFPLLPKLNILRGTVFVDTALVWTDSVQPFTSSAAGRGIKLHDLHAAYGAGLRIPVQGPFGLLNVRIDLAQETDLAGNIGKRHVIFSLGNDF